jgi:hypothetical protein
MESSRFKIQDPSLQKSLPENNKLRSSITERLSDLCVGAFLCTGGHGSASNSGVTFTDRQEDENKQYGEVTPETKI